MTDDLLQHFIVEARELVQQATDDLMVLEGDPFDTARLDSTFRIVHTLKGSVGLFDFAPMGLALHAAEDLLGALREGRGTLDSAVIDSLLDCIDQAERWIHTIEETGRLPPDAAEEGSRLARNLRAQIDERSMRDDPTPLKVDIGWAEELISESPDAVRLRASGTSLVAIRYTPRHDCFFAGDDPLALLRSVPDLVAVRLLTREPRPRAAEMNPFSCNLMIEALSRTDMEAVKAIFRFVPDQVSIHELNRSLQTDNPEAKTGSAVTDPSAGATSRMLRIDAARIDRLADLVGEMVIAKNALAHVASQGSEAKDLIQGIAASQTTIERLVAQMHRAVMDVRMMPMRDIFRRFPRLMRDIAGSSGKTIDFSLEGESVEADKSIVEGLFEPLLHILRNAVAHGAEAEDIRLQAGKPPRARIVLRAYRGGDRVIVEVEDDGYGVDPARVRQVAQERSLAPADRIEQMNDDEILDMIFAPGFSTASEITDLSGRGVGMDAVRSAVERIGGRAGVRSVPGHGTTIHLSLPLTIVMTKVMAVQVGGDLYGIPMDDVVETTFVPVARILPVQDAQAFVLRERTIPLIWLADLLEIPHKAAAGPGAKVVVMSIGGEPVGVGVDGFAERMDVLMRPMGGILASIPGVMGTTLLGNGSVLMILDVPELIG